MSEPLNSPGTVDHRPAGCRPGRSGLLRQTPENRLTKVSFGAEEIILKAIREIVKGNEQRMEDVAKRSPEYGCLLSIPGFGPIVSAMVLAAIGNPFRFENRKQVLRLAGLDLSAERSGKNSDSVKPVISKQGKAALRYALVQAAMISSSLTPDIRSYYSKLLKGRELERGIQLKMKVKLAAKLLVVAWTLMKSKEQFKASCFTG